MHARDLVELAAVVSAHGPVLVGGQEEISESGIEQYWVASKCRLDRWGLSFRKLTDKPGGRASRGRPDSARIQALFEEVLTGEMLTRVWAAVLCLHDRDHQNDRSEPIARSVLVGHLEARHRVLTALARGPDIDADGAMKLNHLRRRTERWTDLLVGYLGTLGDVVEFAVNPDRARDFAEDLGYHRYKSGSRGAWPLLMASLRQAFGRSLQPASPNADLNGQIASSVLSCFQPELFDSVGLLRSLWLERLTHLTDDAAGMIDSLLTTTCGRRAEEQQTSTAARLSSQLRRFGR